MKRSVSALALAAALALPAFSTFAQEAAPERKLENVDAPREAAVEPTEPSGPNTGKVAFSGGVDFTTAYFFRGYNQEDQGLIAQPYANIYFKAVDEEDFKLTPYVGIWNSVHSEQTLADDDGSPAAWYESDIYAGADAAFGPFTLGFIYTLYTYPSGAFSTIGELGAKLSYDDTEVAKQIGLPFALKPYVAAYVETFDDNGSEDWYGEVGIAPGIYTFAEDGQYPVSLSLPVIVGLSLDDYYFDDDGNHEFLGFVSVGLQASVPLAFIPSDYGAWSLTGKVEYLWLNAEGLETANHGDESEIIGKLGISFAY